MIGNSHYVAVIDDVWNKSDLDRSLAARPTSCGLVTTRFDHVMPHDAGKVPLEAMKSRPRRQSDSQPKSIYYSDMLLAGGSCSLYRRATAGAITHRSSNMIETPTHASRNL